MPGPLSRAAILLLSATLTLIAAPGALGADAPTPQAVQDHAEFLAQAPPPASAVGVCVVDTGVTPTPDLAAAIDDRQAIDGGNPDDVRHVDGDPYSGHGTFVASTISAAADGWGSTGLWPQARVVSVRVFGPGAENASAAVYIKALNRCRRYSGVKVINLSLGGVAGSDGELTELQNEIVTCSQRGISVVAAVGNGGGAVTYPARFDGVVGVGATAADGSLVPDSNRDDGLDLLARGQDVALSAFDGTLAGADGTSFAAPQVAAALAALRAYKPELGASETENALLSTAAQTPAGAALNVAAAFRSVGLGELVDAYRPAGESNPGSAAAQGAPSVEHRGPVTLAGPPQGAAGSARARLPRPEIGALRFRRSRLIVLLSNFPPRAKAVWAVGRRHGTSRRARLAIPMKRFARTSVEYRRAGSLVSSKLVVAAPDRRNTAGIRR